jgi:eukaryotic-like serine/threonine-protein kinase
MPSPALCPQCRAENPDTSESCFRCGRALFALVQGSVLSQRYEIERPLGQGGMGRVYQARDCILDETVAIKVLRPELTRDRELAARFRSEIKLARRVTHRNVCRIHEYGEDGRQRFISMEYIDGLNLRDYLRGRAVGAEEAFELSLQMGRGLEAVHELGILHRDFKAANIMVDSRGVVKLMDFGIAKQIGAGPQGITTTGHVMGTPEYMSPEQARGGQVDLRSDLYALGCVIYEAFTGQGLFQGDSAASVLYKHLHEPPPLETTPGLPGPLMPVLARALAKAPSERYRHAAELLEALESARAAAGFRDPGQRAILLPLPVPPQLPGLGVSPATTPLPWPIPPAPAPGALAAPTRFLPRRPALPGSARAVLALMVVAVVGLGYTFWPLPRWTDPAHSPRPMEGTSPSPVPQQPPTTLAAPKEPSPPPPGPEPARGTPAPAPRPTPAAHRPPAGPSPLVASATPAPVHAAEAEPAPRPPLPTPSPVPDAATGTLSLLVVPPAEVTVGALELGLVSSRELALAPGRHAVRVQHPDYEPLQRVVRIRAGETERLVLDLAEKGIPREQR